jgi:hypothetical protein
MSKPTDDRARGRRRGSIRMSATEVSRRFSEVVNRVRWTRQTILVERGGETVCAITPVPGEVAFTGRDFVDLVRSLPHAGEEWARAVEEGVAAQGAVRRVRWR